jgi:hypothetical protein
MKPFNKASEERNFTLGRCRLLRNRAEQMWYAVAQPDATTSKYELTFGLPMQVWDEIADDWNMLHESWGVDPLLRVKPQELFGEQMMMLRTARDQRLKDGVDFSQPKIFNWDADLQQPTWEVGHGSIVRPTVKLRTTEYGGKHYMQVQPVSFQVIKLVEHTEEAGGGASNDNPYQKEEDGGLASAA